MPLLRTTLLAAIFALPALCSAQELELLPAYEPGPPLSGTLAAWGNPEQSAVWAAWTKGFQQYHPHVQFTQNLKSSATIAGALFTGVANICVGGRELMPVENLAYRNIFNREVFRVTTSSGTYNVPQSTPALGIYVAAGNPLGKLTLKQLEAIFGEEHRRGAPANIRTWGQLGLTGSWAGKPIHVYGHAIGMPANALFFASKVFNGSTQWNRNLISFGDLKVDGSKTPGGGAEIIQSVANDPYGIAYTSFDNQTPAVKSLALAATDDGPFIVPAKETVANRTYPLTRNTYLYVNRDPAKGFDPIVADFLKYVLSREGQEAVRNNGYLPLTESELRRQLDRLN